MTSTFDSLAAALADRYRLERELGQGGMATVYRAHDLRHDRKVAIKVLRPELAAVIGAERFLAEIKTTANLQHPHILALFDSGQMDGTVYYVMPFVEGESLRDRLQREKQLPVPDAVRLAGEVASALDYAHRHGVIHRDIKPENVLLHDGSALVADFGIALAVTTAGATRMTETGMSLGTPHYMSPEQAMGEREITARSDVYALGAMTYEMLVGEPPFTGPTAQSILAKVMTAEPTPPEQLRRSVTPSVSQAILTALEKLPADRWPSAREFAEALTGVIDRKTAATPGRGTRSPARRLTGELAGAALLLLATLGLAAWGWLRPHPSSAAPAFISYLPPPGTLDFGGGSRFAELSPDGSRLAFVGFTAQGGAQLWVWNLATRSPRPLEGTNGAEWPFWSPDGKTIGYFAWGWLFQIAASGGGSTRLCRAPTPRGAAWSQNGEILYVAGNGLFRTRGEGGSCELIVADSTRQWSRPTALPDGRHYVIAMGLPGLAGFELHHLDSKTGESRRIGPGGQPVFIAPDYLLYESFKSNTAALLAQRFDTERGVLLGSPVLVADSVWEPSGDLSYTASANGLVLYRRGVPDLYDLIADRSGRVLDTLRQPSTWTHAFARQHNWVALGGRNLWLADLSRSTITSMNPGGNALQWSIAWSPADTAVAYSQDCDVWVRRLAGGQPRKVIASASRGFNTRCNEPTYWSPDGRDLIITARQTDSVASTQVWRYRFADSSYGPLLGGGRNYMHGVISPDGRWLAYASDETGNFEVYLAPYPAGAPGRRVSLEGGVRPRWRGDGRELYFYAPRGEVMRVSVEGRDDPTIGVPAALFSMPSARADLVVAVPYDVSPDGQRFVLHPPSTPPYDPLVMLSNWPALVGLAR